MSVEISAGFLHSGNIRHRDRPGASDGNGLELLLTHDRPRPAPVRQAVPILDGGEADQGLTGWADGGHLNAAVAGFPPDDGFRLQAALACQGVRLAEMNLTVIDEQVYGSGSCASNNNSVESGSLQGQ
jgi:hypothetical protein